MQENQQEVCKNCVFLVTQDAQEVQNCLLNLFVVVSCF